MERREAPIGGIQWEIKKSVRDVQYAELGRPFQGGHYGIQCPHPIRISKHVDIEPLERADEAMILLSFLRQHQTIADTFHLFRRTSADETSLFHVPNKIYR